MATVIEFTGPARAGAVPLYERVRRVSRSLEWLFAGLCALLAVVAVFSLWVIFFYPGSMIALGPAGGLITTEPLPPGYVPFARMRLDNQLAYGVVSVVRGVPAIALFWLLRSLFRRYGRGEVFSARNAALIQAMGACLAADAVLPFLCHLALSSGGWEIDRAWAHMTSVQELVLGAVVLVVARVMQAAHEIEQDREGFV